MGLLHHGWFERLPQLLAALKTDVATLQKSHNSLDFAANFAFPEVGDLFEEIIFSELDQEEASKLIEEYRKDAKQKGPPPEKRFRGLEEIITYIGHVEFAVAQTFEVYFCFCELHFMLVICIVYSE